MKTGVNMGLMLASVNPLKDQQKRSAWSVFLCKIAVIV